MNSKFENNKKIVALISFFVLVAFVALVSWYIGRPMLKLVEQPEVFREWIDSKGIPGRFIFIGMVALQVIFAIIPGEPLEIGAGYAFGAIEGTILCLVGFLLGSTVIYFLVKKWGIRFIELFFPVRKINELRFLNTNKKLGIVAVLLFLIPGTPKDILVYFLGVTNIKPWLFFVTATVVRLPSLVTSTICGNALGLQNYMSAIIVFAITLVISLVGLIVYKLIVKIHSRK